MNMIDPTGSSNILYTDPKTGASLRGLHYDGPHDFSMLLQLTKTPPESLLYNGGTERCPMTEAGAAALAKKYDPTNMTQKEYESFLDELQGMGVISEMEKLQMGYMRGAYPLGYIDADGDYVWTESSSHFLDDADATEDARNLGGSLYIGLGDDGNLKRRLDALGQWEICKSTCENPDTQRAMNKTVRQEKKRLSLMTGIVNNMLEYRRAHHLPVGENAQAEEEKEDSSDLLERASAPGGEFWLDLRNLIMENARSKRMRDEEDKTLRMLGEMLEDGLDDVSAAERLFSAARRDGRYE